MKKYKFILIISPIILILDQLTKYWAVTSLKGKEETSVITGYFDFIFRENKGAAWSFLADQPDSFRVPFFIIAIIIALVIVFFLYKNLEDNQILLKVAFASIIGGALGNLSDRFFRGAVVDFIDWHYKEVYHWPTFNIADVGLVIAMVLIAYEAFIGENLRKKKEALLKEDSKSDLDK